MGLFDFITGNKPADPNTPRRTPAQLTQALLALSTPEQPWHVREGRAGEPDLVAEWKIVDARWYETFAKAGLTSVFRILMRLDPATSTVRAVDQETSIAWEAGIPRLTIVASAFRGQEIKVARGWQFGITEKGQPGVIYDYKFTTAEIKTPLQQTVAQNGWAWRGVTFGTL